jgi:hypothetical protein
MSKITVCLDCPSYQKGGYCPHKRKEVSALDPACDHAKIMNAKFNPEDEDAPMQTVTESHQLPTTKKCERCGEVLPFDDFEWMNYKGTRKRMRICSKCYHAAMSKTKTKTTSRKAKPEVPEGMKICSRCKEVKPLTEFHKDCYAPDGHKSACKVCHSKIVSEKQKTRRDARRQELIAQQDTEDAKVRKTVKPQKTIVVRETLTDEQMVNILREHGWEVTCRRTVTQEI